MTHYLLDRDVLSTLENPQGNKNVRAWVNTIPDSDLFLPAVIVMEAQKGFTRLSLKTRTAAELKTIQDFQKDFDSLLASFAGRILPIDEAVAKRWGEMLAQHEAHIIDTAIAATASVYGLIVVTRNLKDYRGRGIKLIDPFKAKPKIV